MDTEMLGKKSSIIRWTCATNQGLEAHGITSSDGTFRMFRLLEDILHILDRQDIQDLYRYVQGGSEGKDDVSLLLHEFKFMYEPHNVDQGILKDLENQVPTYWRYYRSCGIHTLDIDDVTYYMLQEKRYPFGRRMLERMLDLQLEVS